MKKGKLSIYLTTLVLVFLLTGCQPKVYLMPAPIGIETDSRFFRLSEENIDDNLLYTLYATNRKPLGTFNRSKSYSIFPGDNLDLGIVVHRVGKSYQSWEEYFNKSMDPERTGEHLLELEFAREMARYNISADPGFASERAEGFFEQINSALARTLSKDILVYVHGANSNFYRATAQGAQLFYFTGYNALVLTFCWPSAENILKYNVDVAHARQTIPAFAKLIEILAQNTEARNINILAYSAGARVVVPGLAYLRESLAETPAEKVKSRLRIGEVYLAAPDTELSSFITRYNAFKPLVGRTSIAINTKDSVLRLSALQNGISSLGRPDLGELSRENGVQLLNIINAPDFDVIDIAGSKTLEAGGSHDFWYNHPWVSNDLLLLMLFGAEPAERGLVRRAAAHDAKIYVFPEDYGEKIRKILADHREDFYRQIENEKDRTP